MINKKITSIFTDKFLEIDPEVINDHLIEKGYFSFENALKKEALESIKKDATNSRLGLNKNIISGVYDERQYYLTNLLAVSKTFYDFATSSLVFEICRNYLGEKFRLKALRYYETYGGHHMRWHTDNKTDRGFAHIPGIIFIFYIADVQDGQFQYIEGSHNWSGEKAYSDYSDEFVEKNYQEKIIDFRLSAGSLVIYNSYGIHRAKPVRDVNFIRKSVFFQVDSEIENSEPIIVNTEYITEVNNDITMFLGFGKPSNYSVFPVTSLKSLPLTKNIFRLLLGYIYFRIKSGLYSILSKIYRVIFSS